MNRYPPGPTGLESIATVFRFQRDPLNTLTGLVERYGDVVCYRFGPFPVVLLNCPEVVNLALVDHHPNYGKEKNPFYRMLRSFLGEGLLTSDGPFWLRQRRLAQPAFARKKIDAMAETMRACTEQMLARWRTLPEGARIDLEREMMALTLRIAGLTLFSQDLSSTSRAVGVALDEIQVQMGKRFSSLVPLPPILPTPHDRRFREADRQLRSLALEIVEQRRRDPSPPEDLLTSLLQARDEKTGEQMSDRQLCDELITLLLAGHETTANAMIWSLVLLSWHPAVRRELETELAMSNPPAMGKGLVDRVILETLRMYPPAWVIGRISHGPDRYLDYEVGGGQIVTISPYVLHRHPDYWPNPEGFDPERFLQPIPRGAFIPFAAGPRQCIGNHFALLEAREILSALTREFRLNLVPGCLPRPDAQITLRPHQPVSMTLERR